MNLNLKKPTWVHLPVFGGSTSPFIEEGDGFTRERERVRTFLSLVAHADGDGTMVGAVILLMSLQNVRYMWEVELLSSRLKDVGTCKNIVSRTGGMALQCSPSTVNSGAHNTVDAQRHMGVLAYGCFDRRLQYYRGKCCRLQYCSW